MDGAREEGMDIGVWDIRGRYGGGKEGARKGGIEGLRYGRRNVWREGGRSG